MRVIAQISDLHFGRHSAAMAQDLLASVSEVAPDLVVFSGDFTQRARRREFFQAREFLDRIAQPKLVVPGNHDVPLYNLFARFLRPLAKYDHFVSPVGLTGGLFRDDEIAVLGLNTARSLTRKNGRLSLTQIAQIGDTLGHIGPDVLKVLVTHHPLRVPTGEAALELAGRSDLAFKAISEAGVHLLLSGHHHRALTGGFSEVGSEGSLLVFHAGTAISTRLRGGEGNSYNLIALEPNRVGVNIMEWQPDGGFRKTRAMDFVLNAGRWRPA